MGVWFDLIQLTLVLSIGWLGALLLRFTREGVITGMRMTPRHSDERLRVAKRQATDSEG